MISFSKLLLESYNFRNVPIYVTQEHYNEAIHLHETTPFKSCGFGEFLSSVFLWRVIDEKELEIIIKTKQIIGGAYAIPIERKYGASFSGSRDDVISWGLKVKANGRLTGQLYVIGINADEKQFFNLDMVGRLKEQGLEYSVGAFNVDTSLGNTGLGFSVQATSADIYHVFKLGDDKKLTDITDDIWGQIK